MSFGNSYSAAMENRANPFVQRTRESRRSLQFGRQRSRAADNRRSAYLAV
jgi:hypothetical protein